MRGVSLTAGEITIEPLLRTLRAARIDLARIEPPALLLVLEQVVGGRKVLEIGFRLLVARMQVGMEFACQFLVCGLDLRVGRGSVDAKRLVRVLHASDPMPANIKRECFWWRVQYTYRSLDVG